MKQAQIVAVSNQKGGVGKTTTCLSVGACLAEAGWRTLVVDLDAQADLTLAAGLAPDGVHWTVADLLPQGDTLRINSHSPKAEEAIQPSAITNLDVLPGDPRLAATEHKLYDQQDYETCLKQILPTWQGEYDYILLDCPPSLGALTLIALTAARHLLVPIQCEYYAARAVNRLLEIVDLVQERTNPNLRYYLVATLYDQRNRICRAILEQLRTHFADRLLETVIGVDTRLRECPAVGEPVTLYAPRTRASRQYRALARELATKLRE